MDSSKRDEPNSERGGSPLLAVARRRWWVVALTTIFAVSAAVGALKLIKPSYTATATLQAPISTGVQTPTDLTYLDRLMNTYTKLAQQPSLKAAVASQLGRRAPQLSVSVEPNTELLDLSATDHSPTVAWQAANIAASVLVSSAGSLEQSTSNVAEKSLQAQLATLTNKITSLRIRLASVGSGGNDQRLALEQQISGLQADFNALVSQRAQLQLADATRNQSLSIVQSASIPRSPSSPRWVPVLALAFGLGLLGGLALAFLFERLVPRLYTVEAIEAAADADVVAAIPRVSGKLADSHLYNGGSAAQEAFGMLAVRLLAEASSRRVRTILVTSRTKGDGKSTIAANLASELARTGRSVVLVDADMRSPSAHEIFEIDGDVGLSNLLELPHSGDQPLEELDEFIIHPEAVPELGVIPAGAAPAAPARLLASRRLTTLVDELAHRYQFVIFDAPPLTVSDPLSVAALADTILLIVGGSAVPDREINAATRQLSGIGKARVSVVVNRWRANEPYYTYGYPAARS